MTAWTADELRRIGGAEKVQISSRRPDGSLRPFVTISKFFEGAPCRQSGSSGNSGNCSPSQPSSSAIRSSPELPERMTFS
jgi:hypothetical protein